MNTQQTAIAKKDGQAQQPASKDKAKIMYDALVKIAHSDCFFDEGKRLTRIARKAIQEVTEVDK